MNFEINFPATNELFENRQELDKLIKNEFNAVLLGGGCGCGGCDSEFFVDEAMCENEMEEKIEKLVAEKLPIFSGQVSVLDLDNL